MNTEKTIYRMAALFFAALAFSVLAGGCSAGRYRGAPSMEAAYSRAVVMGEAAADMGSPNLPEAGVVPETDPADPRKLVRRANISIRVQNPEKTCAALAALMEQHGAYASSMNVWENSRSYTIRVPAASYTALLSALDGMGRVLHRSESAEDVTLRYYDLEGRLATKRALLGTYRSYLARAANIEEILSVEAKIAELEDDIDGTGKELRSLANMVDYATVDLEIQGPETVPSYAAPTLGERIAGLFSAFGEFLSRGLVILLGIVVYGIPVLIILTLLFWLLFGRIGLMKKLWRLAAGKRGGALRPERVKNTHTDQHQE
jgi:hypothetical protein